MSMNRTWKLLQFEFNRLWKVLVGLILFNMVVQPLGVIWSTYRYFDRDVSAGTTLEMPGTVARALAFNEVTQSGIVTLAILFTVFALIFYAFYTWYREWYGKSRFSYRLMMIPGNRMQVYFAKLLALYIGVLLLVALQIVLLAVGNWIFEWVLSEDVIRPIHLFELYYWNDFGNEIFLPVLQIMINRYVMGFMTLNIVFVGILLERSFGLAGFISGLAFYLISLIGSVAVISVIGGQAYKWYLFYDEALYMMYGIMVLYTLICIGISHYLINHRLRV